MRSSIKGVQMVMTIPKDVDMTFDDSAREKANKELTNLHSQVAP